MVDLPETSAVFTSYSKSPMHEANHPQDTRQKSSAPWPIQAGSPPRIRIWVVDNGIGIPPHAHEKIFGIFERVSGNDKIEGTGIGLAIVARAMQQMGGACGVESRENHGSRFWLELAAAQ